MTSDHPLPSRHPRKAKPLAGVLLVVFALALLADQGLRYTVGETPFELPWPGVVPSVQSLASWAPLLAALALVAGVLLLVAATRSLNR